MSDTVKKGRLSPLAQQKLIAHLREKWGRNKPCPMCGSVQWTVGFWIELRIGDLFAAEQNIPVAPVICSICGNVVMVSTKIVGISEIDDLAEVDHIGRRRDDV